MQDYEKLGVFYLGRHYDLKKKKSLPELVLYESKHLVTHGLVVGMTGSGKTGLCFDIIEEAAIDGIPSIVIDPKGDLGNLHAHVSRAAPAGFRAVDQRGRRAEEGSVRGRLRRAAGRALAQGPRQLGSGRRTHPAVARRGGVRPLHAGQQRGSAGFDPEIVRRAAAGNSRGR